MLSSYKMTITATLSKLSAILILICLLLIAAYPIYAVDSSTAATKREQAKERVAQQRAITQDRMMDLKEKIASRQAELKAKLQTFRDQRKAQLVERINTTLSMINQKMTEQMMKHLDRMTTILNKLDDRVNKPTSDIKDPNLAKAAIADARAAIATASAAVQNQATIDYTIHVSTESAVRADAKAARDKLHADLRTVRELVIKAKQAVGNAIRVAKSGKLHEGSESGKGKEGSASGQQ